MTWSNFTEQAEFQSCLLSQWKFDERCEQYEVSDTYRISANISGSDLGCITYTEGYNRQGPQCRQCIDGYGPVLFTDGTLCTDYLAKQQHLWIFYGFLRASEYTSSL